MRQFLFRIQLWFVSVILLATLALTLAIVVRHNRRWDLTQDRIYSLAEPVRKLIERLNYGPIEVLAFYPYDDRTQYEFEVFLKECQTRHPNFKYKFYDPDRVPRLAKELHVKDLYTVVVRFEDRQERIIRPTEQSFANALVRLANPRAIQLCFMTGHGEISLSREDRGGYHLFRQALEDRNYTVEELILLRDKVPDHCDVIVAGGPHRELDREEYRLLKEAFDGGKGLLLLLDPMDPGSGESFRTFVRSFGIEIGADVIVDKMSRLVGGDFLVPLVSQYMSKHPITEEFDLATFFPVARSVQPSSEPFTDWEITPLAFTGSGSWAETNLQALESGEAVFDVDSDLSGPVSVAVAARRMQEDSEDSGGRIVVIGDSDFVSNAYLDLSGNEDFALNVIAWLVKDTRTISINPRELKFKPVFLNAHKRFMVFAGTVFAMPLAVIVIGGVRILWRARGS